MKNRRLSARGLLFLMIAVLLVMTACSSKNNEPAGSSSASSSPSASASTGGSESPSNAEEPTELSIMWWGPDARHEATMKALDIYKSQNPSISFKPEYMAFDGFWAKMPTLVASKTVPDVLQMDSQFIQEYVANGVLEDLSDIDVTGIIDQKTLDVLKIDGKLYGIPLSINATGHAVNKAELEAHGVALPQTGWTWDEYFAWAREARKKLPKDKYPIGQTLPWDQYQYYQTSYGKGPIMSEGGKKFNLDKELFVKFYTTQLELLKEGVVPPTDVQASFVDSDPQADQMASGKVMTKNVTVNTAQSLESLMPGKVTVISNPVGSAGGGWAQSTVFFSVNAASKQKDKGKELIKWLLTNPEAGKALGMTRGIPINDAIYKEIEPTLEPKDVLGKQLVDAAKPHALPFYGAAAGYTEWLDLFVNETMSIMYAKTTVEEAYNKLNDLGQQIAASK